MVQDIGELSGKQIDEGAFSSYVNVGMVGVVKGNAPRYWGY